MQHYILFLAWLNTHSAPVLIIAFGTGVPSAESLFHCSHPSALSCFCVCTPHPVQTNEPETQIPSSVAICHQSTRKRKNVSHCRQKQGICCAHNQFDVSCGTNRREFHQGLMSLWCSWYVYWHNGGILVVMGWLSAVSTNQGVTFRKVVFFCNLIPYFFVFCFFLFFRGTVT